MGQDGIMPEGKPVQGLVAPGEHVTQCAGAVTPVQSTLFVTMPPLKARVTDGGVPTRLAGF